MRLVWIYSRIYMYDTSFLDTSFIDDLTKIRNIPIFLKHTNEWRDWSNNFRF